LAKPCKCHGQNIPIPEGNGAMARPQYDYIIYHKTYGKKQHKGWFTAIPNSWIVIVPISVGYRNKNPYIIINHN